SQDHGVHGPSPKRSLQAGDAAAMMPRILLALSILAGSSSPPVAPVEVPLDHPIYHLIYDFPKGIPKIHFHDGKPAQGFGIFLDGRLAVYYSYQSDLGDGW